MTSKMASKTVGLSKTKKDRETLPNKRIDGEWSFGNDRPEEQTKQNLKLSSASNQECTQQFIGVKFDKTLRKWRMKLKIKSFEVSHDQLFSDGVEAAKHYDQLVRPWIETYLYLLPVADILYQIRNYGFTRMALNFPTDDERLNKRGER